MRVLVIGAGAFGCNIAIELDKANYEVDLVEASNDVLLHASKHNHNRLHLGYHYLRSKQTAQQSIEGLLSFLFYYGDSVLHSFPNYYAIASEGSYTSADGFIEFCDAIGIGYDEEFPAKNIMTRELVNGCFKVPEPVFDYSILKNVIVDRLKKSNISLHLNTTLTGLSFESNSKIYTAETTGFSKEYDVVVNATYSNLNEVNSLVGAKKRKIKYQDVIIPNFEFEHSPIGLTIMDGPFCSVMPRGKETNKFLLYHVSDSVLKSEIAIDLPDLKHDSPDFLNTIYNHSMDYFPFLEQVKHIDSYRTIRAVHENNDDARITELEEHEDFPNYFSVLSGKITTCVQVSLTIKHKLQNKIKNAIL